MVLVVSSTFGDGVLLVVEVVKVVVMAALVVTLMVRSRFNNPGSMLVVE